jgi:drug/metabolite transporter (DMT)-like permease
VIAPPHPRTGVWLSLASAALAALFLIPYKLAGERAPADLVTLALLVCAAVFNTLATAGGKLGAMSAGARPPARSLGLALLVAAVIAVLTAGGNFGVAAALASGAAPGLVSVVQQTQVVFVAAASAVLLGERVTLRFGVGVAVALAGFVVMQLPGGDVADAAPASGLLWALLSALCFGLMLVITRMVIHRIDPVLVNALRLWLAVALIIALPGRLAGALALDLATWGLAAAAAFSGPFLARLCLMFAVRHISAARVALIALATPVLAFLLGFAALGIAPTLRELIGGALILAGIALPLLERAAKDLTPPPGGALPLTDPR